MAYVPPHIDRRGPSEHSPSSPYERPAQTWSSGYVPPSQRPFGHVPLHQLQASHSASALSQQDDMNPENEDSDVSVTKSDPYRSISSPATPVRVPPAPLRLESQDAIDRRLVELSRSEDQNSAKSRDLRIKRQRMDDRITQKRDAQDRKMKSIMEARSRKDARIKARRAREDAEFQRVFDQIEQEEEKLRRRLKRLKRGLPLDDSPQIGARSISAASASPPGPSYSTVPPPAKRHQSNPPGHNDSPAQSHASVPHPPPTQAPSYSFYGGGPKPYSAPSHNSPSYSTTPPTSMGPSASSSMATERFGAAVNGRPGSPLSKPPQPTTATSGSGLSTVPPPRNATSAYDTRPPPAASSGFTTVNAPPTSGFAPVNPRSAGTPPSNHNGSLILDEQHKIAINQTHSDSGKPSSNGSTPGGGKRTPSTTHPYQMSEAFANRHHHCERVDDLNRGIWTSYGPGGSQDHPTGPPVQMYLRCNHENCRRIDWRTVHGLQCHIVKNHEQPKGTIGSLEKALDRYGVPVKEVEDYEREHGEGSGGTMADPKNLKIKNKTREAGFGRKTTPGSYGVDPNARPAGYKPSPTASPTSVQAVPRHGGPPPAASTAAPNNTTANKSAAGAWSSINAGSPYGPPRAPVDTSKQLQGDAVMKAPPATSTPSSATPSERRPYDFPPRPFEYPSRAPPLTPGSAPAKSPTMQNGPSWRVSTGPKASPQSPPSVKPFSMSWASRPVWGTDSRLADKAAADAKARTEERIEADKKTEETVPKGPLRGGGLGGSPRSVLDGQAPKDAEKPGFTSASPNAARPPSSTEMNIVVQPKQTDSTLPAVGNAGQAPASEQSSKFEPKPADKEKPKDTTPQVAPTSSTSVNANAMEPPSSTSTATATPTTNSASGSLSGIATAGGPATGTRSAQSPSVATKPPSAPTSVRRGSRRSSVAATAATTGPLPQADVMANATAGGAENGSREKNDATAAVADKKDEVDRGSTRGTVDEGDGDGDSITVTASKEIPGFRDSPAVAPRGTDDGSSKEHGKDGGKNEGKEEIKATAADVIKDKDKDKPRDPKTPPPRRAASGRVTRKRTLG